MTAPYGALKLIGMIVWGLASSAIAIMDPTIKGFVVAGILACLPPTIVGLFSHWDTVSKLKIIGGNVDGKLTRILDKQDKTEGLLTDKTAQLTVAKVDLATATGRREGVESKEKK